MADLSLKGLEDGLMKAVKLAAFTAGKSQREFVIGILEKEVLYVSNGVSDRVREDAGDSTAGRGTRKTRTGNIETPEGVGKTPAKERSKTGPGERLKSGVGGHDTKHCRVYRCGRCSGLGVKDAQRGLK